MRRDSIRDSAAEWRAIARGPNLLHHIRTPPGGSEMWSEETFYDSGRSDWSDFVGHWAHYEPALAGRCVEIGCGAGRLTGPLSEFFDEVFCVDVSSDMIALASARSAGNVEFAQVSGCEIPLPDSSCDAVFTVHVLQHLNDQQAVLAYLSEAFRVLRANGTVMAHIMLSGDEIGPVRRLVREARIRHSRRRLRRGLEHTAVRMVFPATGEALRMMSAAGFRDVELRVFRVRSDGSVHSFFFGRR